MKTIFWDVDTQYDFMKSTGKLYVPDAEIIENNLTKLTQLAERKKIVVINTADWHNINSKELSNNPDYINTFPQHCMKNTKGAEFVQATNPKDPYKVGWENKDLDLEEITRRRNIIIYKDMFDVFKGNPKTEQIVRIINPDRVVVYGVATNVCVNDAVNGLLERKIKVYVPTDAIKELPGLPLPYDNWTKKGVILTKTNEIYKMLEKRK